MKKNFILLFVFLITHSLFSQRIKGSDTVLPVAQKHAEEYMKIHSNSRVTVTGGGSGVGLSALYEGTTDLAMSSRKIKFEEKIKFQKKKIVPAEVIVAYDALAIIVHPSNPINQLTRKQLEDIFTGKIRNWKQLGGEDIPIVTYSRETSSGTYEFFKEKILRNKNYINSVLSMPATGAIIQSVRQTKGAIGYVGLAYVSPDIKAIRVSYDGKTYVAPTFKNAKDKTYPVVRPLYYYYDKSIENIVSSFINYSLSPKGQKLIENIGYIPR